MQHQRRIKMIRIPVRSTHIINSSISCGLNVLGIRYSSSHATSSCSAGTLLNLNVKKGGKEPVALEDSEYPEWLWGVLDSKAAANTSDALDNKTADLQNRKKTIRKANRERIKQNNFLAQL